MSAVGMQGLCLTRARTALVRVRWRTGLGSRDRGHTHDVSTLLIVAVVMIGWCVLPLPLAVAVGRALRRAETEARFAEIIRDYDTVGV
jgi:hypothetical protein